MIDMNTDFPPLSTSVLSNHQQKQSDPPPPPAATAVSAAAPPSPVALNTEGKESSSLVEEKEVMAITEPMLEATASQSPLSSVDNATTSQEEDHSSDDMSVSPDETSQTESVPEKPAELSESPVTEDQEKEKEGVIEAEKLEGSTPPVVATADGNDSGMATQPLLAVGSRPFKSTVLATSTTPMNQQVRAQCMEGEIVSN